MLKKVTKKELAELLAEKHGLTKKDATEVLGTVLDAITENMKNGVVTDLAGFGKFVVKERKARTGINPLTKQEIHIEAKKVPGFRPAKALKEVL